MAGDTDEFLAAGLPPAGGHGVGDRTAGDRLDGNRGGVAVLDLGRRDYGAVWALQRELVERRAAGGPADTLILVEHDPAVVTVGRGHRGPHPVVPAGVRVDRVERGGDVTWHGPGQLVGYPVVLLRDHDARAHLRRIERYLVSILDGYDIPGEARAGATGVWVGERKVASIGVAVRRWVAYHGFALNVTTDPAVWRGLNPCGFAPEVMTSLAELLGRPVDLADVRARAAALADRLRPT